MILVTVIIILALVFDYINGFHDAANSIATVVSTKVLTPFQAVIWAAFFNCVAYFIFKDHAVANTISKTVHKEFITLAVILSGLIAAIFWNLLTWWYGIPSSSSHTLVGGLAGAAIAHGMATKGVGVSWASILESDTIIEIVVFILFAPLVGMFISIFITVVTIMRNVWLRLGIIALATFLTFLAFNKFEQTKMDKGLQKFLKVDKYKAEIKEGKEKLVANPSDSAAIKFLATAEEKLAKALPNYEKLKAEIANYDEIGAPAIAKKAKDNGLLKDIEASRLKDDIRNANGYLVLESKSTTDAAINAEFSKAKKLTEDYKVPLKKFCNKELSADSTMTLLNAIYPIAPGSQELRKKVQQKLESFSIEKAFAKDIQKSDNSIAWYIVLGIAITFSLAYLYIEKVRTPNAYKMANMFKKLQLVSSAAFSIGHGVNDAQKVMGIIGVALITGGQMQNFSDLPNWVPIACYLAIGIGTMSGGWKIVKTMGTKITKVTPLEGVAAETAGALTLFFTGQQGIPVSSTHTITGSIIGVGATKRLSAVRWGVTVNLLWAWILTIPVSAVLAAITYFVVRFFLGHG
jgi:inorganic phosphate transporter, PiT family